VSLAKSHGAGLTLVAVPVVFCSDLGVLRRLRLDAKRLVPVVGEEAVELDGVD
jgi:hypothetical protein